MGNEYWGDSFFEVVVIFMLEGEFDYLLIIIIVEGV